MPVSNDDLIAFFLIGSWSLVTGRRLRRDVPPGELTESELIDFWADDHLWPDDQPRPAPSRDERCALSVNRPEGPS